ncbi:DedA family protein, partial [Patescibacteria group bacterium]|nr:DedA family protein [Patescibacteria group bacterium]
FRPGQFNFWILVLIGALGNLAGSVLAYLLGYMGEETVLRFIRTKGKYFFIREREFVHATTLFAKYGEVIVFVSRLLPAIRTYISLPAGVARMDKKKFIGYTFVGSLLWSIVLTYLGVLLGANWHQITPYFHYFDLIVIAAAFLLFLYFSHKKIRLLS